MSILINKCLNLSSNYSKYINYNCSILLCVKRYLKTKETNSESPEEQKLLHVAVVGVPNAGKSTFINSLINHRVCPTSNKVHTTRKSNKAICTINNTQLVLFDTPGLVTSKEYKKHNLTSSFKSSYKHSIQHANIIAVIHDVSNSWTRHELHSTVLDTLNSYPKLPSILVMNKIDTLKSKRTLLDLVRILTNDSLVDKIRFKQYRSSAKTKSTPRDENDELQVEKSTGWSNFSEIFMASSITGDGSNEVLQYLLMQAKPNKWLYPAEAFTDELPEEIIVESVRARLLDYLPQEIPYKLKSEIEYYNCEKGTIYTSVLVNCPNSRVERLICGESNGKLKQITERVTSDLVETFGKPISLTISTTSSKRHIESN